MSGSTTRLRPALLAILLAAGCAGGSSLETGDPIIVRRGPRAPEMWRRDVGRAVELAPLPLDEDWIVAPTEGAVRRLRGADGKELWKRKLSGGAACVPVLASGVLVVAWDYPGGEVSGLDASTGKVLWKWGKSLGYLAATDTVVVFSGRGGRLLGLDPRTGRVAWEGSRPGTGWNEPVADPARGTVYVPVRPDSVIAVDGQGRERWARRAGRSPRMAIGPSGLAIATDDSLLLLWDPDTGEERARRPIGGICAGRPQARGPLLYVALRDGGLYALDAVTLEERWSRRFESPFLSAPAVSEGLLYQSGTRGRVFVLEVGSGAPVDTLYHPEAIVASPGLGSGTTAVGGDEGTVAVYRSAG